MSVIDLVTGKPKTIEELQAYCDRNDLYASKTRFFVGEDYREPRAFGIYKDEETGEFVVYKNKDDGVRAVRYRGTNEEYAVSELYDRLQAEIANQKSHYYGYSESRRSTGSAPDFGYMDEEDDSEDGSDIEYDSSYSNESNVLKFVYGAIILFLIIFVLAMKGNSGSGSRYNSGYSSYDRYDSYDSGWSSDSWDSGYTDWGSDW